MPHTQSASSGCSSSGAPRWRACPTTGPAGSGPGSYSKPGPPFLTRVPQFPLGSEPWFPPRRTRGIRAPYPPTQDARLPSHVQGLPCPGGRWQGRAAGAA